MKIFSLERMIGIGSLGLQPGDVVPELARIQRVEVTEHPLYRPVGMDGLAVEIL